MFGKQVDKLQTNHRGVFVLKDFQFRWLSRVSCADLETKYGCDCSGCACDGAYPAS